MFETAILDGGPSRGALSFSGSLFLQCGIGAGLVCASLLMPVALPDVPELNIAPPAPRPYMKLITRSLESAALSVPAARRPIFTPFKLDVFRAAQSTSREIEVMSEGLPVLGSGVGVPDGVAGAVQMPKVAAPPPLKPVIVEAPKPQPAGPVRIGGEVLASKLIHKVQPLYPPIARQTRIQGVVQLHGVISKDGHISQLRVVSGHPLLVKAALDAVQQWVYSPTYLNQQPVEVEAPIEVRFVLSQ